MERSHFESALRRATCAAIDVAREVVVNTLPDSARYWASIGFEEGRGGPCEGEHIRKELALPEPLCHGPWNIEQVLDYYWVDGTVPTWIQTLVGDYDDQHTFLWLAGCVVFTARDIRSYGGGEVAPFGVVGPSRPRNWPRDVKFDLRAGEGYPGNWFQPAPVRMSD